jgi:hypothetical protein
MIFLEEEKDPANNHEERGHVSSCVVDAGTITIIMSIERHDVQLPVTVLRGI